MAKGSVSVTVPPEVTEALERCRVDDALGYTVAGQYVFVDVRRHRTGQDAIDPDVVLADEPTGNLDSKTGMIVMDFLKRLHKEKGKTIVMVTHDPRLSKVAERTEYLHDGRIVKSFDQDTMNSLDDYHNKMKKVVKNLYLI